MKIIKDENGGSLVEFVIIAPLLLLILFGIIEFGLVLYNKAVLTNACREGARYGIVMTAGARHTGAEIQTEVYNASNTLLFTFGAANNPVVTANPSDGSGSYPGQLSVNVTWQYTFLVLPRFTTGGLTNPLNLSATTVMNYE